MAERYKKSVAEQNSVDLCWALLMKAEYAKLRGCIYANEDECRRFRQLVVNVVMATDICDKELQALRKARWNKAFDDRSASKGSGSEDINRKATIVLEHLIQARYVLVIMLKKEYADSVSLVMLTRQLDDSDRPLLTVTLHILCSIGKCM